MVGINKYIPNLQEFVYEIKNNLNEPGSFRPVSRFAPFPVRPGSFRPYSLLARVVTPSFSSALKNEIWKIPLQIFVFWVL